MIVGDHSAYHRKIDFVGIPEMPAKRDDFFAVLNEMKSEHLFECDFEIVTVGIADVQIENDISLREL